MLGRQLERVGRSEPKGTQGLQESCFLLAQAQMRPAAATSPRWSSTRTPLVPHPGFSQPHSFSLPSLSLSFLLYPISSLSHTFSSLSDTCPPLTLLSTLGYPLGKGRAHCLMQEPKLAPPWTSQPGNTARVGALRGTHLHFRRDCQDRISVYSAGYLETYCVDHAGLELRFPPISAPPRAGTEGVGYI